MVRTREQLELDSENGRRLGQSTCHESLSWITISSLSVRRILDTCPPVGAWRSRWRQGSRFRWFARCGFSSRFSPRMIWPLSFHGASKDNLPLQNVHTLKNITKVRLKSIMVSNWWWLWTTVHRQSRGTSQYYWGDERELLAKTMNPLLLTRQRKMTSIYEANCLP